MSRATELKGVRDTIDELREGVEALQRTCHTAVCIYCRKRDFLDNLEMQERWLGPGVYQHEACRLRATGSEVCPKCAGKGEVKKVVARKAKKKGKANASS